MVLLGVVGRCAITGGRAFCHLRTLCLQPACPACHLLPWRCIRIRSCRDSGRLSRDSTYICMVLLLLAATLLRAAHAAEGRTNCVDVGGGVGTCDACTVFAACCRSSAVVLIICFWVLSSLPQQLPPRRSRTGATLSPKRRRT